MSSYLFRGLLVLVMFAGLFTFRPSSQVSVSEHGQEAGAISILVYARVLAEEFSGPVHLSD